MEVVFWLLIVASFVLAFVGLLMPVIPSALFLWVAVLIYAFGIGPGQLGPLFWVVLVMATVMLIVSDIIVNRQFLKRSDSSDMSARVGPLAIIVGAFVIPPFGLVVVPFVAVFLTELLHKKPYQQALRIALITVLSFLTSTLAKALMLLAVVGFFIASIIF